MRNFFEICIGALFEVLQLVPKEIWTALTASMTTLLGVGLTLRHNARLKVREQQLAIHRDVYLPASEALANQMQVIGQLAELSNSEKQLSEKLMTSSAQLMKVFMTGSNDTVEALISFVSKVQEAFGELALMRMPLMMRQAHLTNASKLLERKNQEIDRYFAMQSQMKLQGAPDQHTWNTINSFLESERAQRDKLAEEIRKLWTSQNREHIQFARAMFQASENVREYAPDLLLAIRKELKMPLDERAIRTAMKASGDRQKETLDKFLKALEGKIDA